MTYKEYFWNHSRRHTVNISSFKIKIRNLDLYVCGPKIFASRVQVSQYVP